MNGPLSGLHFRVLTSDLSDKAPDTRLKLRLELCLTLNFVGVTTKGPFINDVTQI